jgi:hypothetical protein
MFMKCIVNFKYFVVIMSMVGAYQGISAGNTSGKYNVTPGRLQCGYQPTHDCADYAHLKTVDYYVMGKAQSDAYNKVVHYALDAVNWLKNEYYSRANVNVLEKIIIDDVYGLWVYFTASRDSSWQADNGQSYVWNYVHGNQAPYGGYHGMGNAFIALTKQTLGRLGTMMNYGHPLMATIYGKHLASLVNVLNRYPHYNSREKWFEFKYLHNYGP